MTKKHFILVVLILLDIVIVQKLLTPDDNVPVAPPAASATRTPPKMMPVRVTRPTAANDTPSPTPTASRVAPAPPATYDTPTPADRPPPTETPTPEVPAPADNDPSDSTDGSQPVIHVNGAVFVARPFETVRVMGTYIGARARTILRVQQHQGGDWVDFPLPTTTDDSGDFTAYVELGSPGEHRVRIVDPATNTVSESVIVVIS
jgi:hypothetical protein